MKKILIPITILLVLGLLSIALFRNQGPIPSPLIGKHIPSMELPTLYDETTLVVESPCADTYCLINIFASWCPSCLREHPELLTLQEKSEIVMVGVNHVDAANDAIAWLEKHGNPYHQIFYDEAGDYGFTLGSYGTPESYLINPMGIVLKRWAGPLTADEVLQVVQNDR